jgi:hypothetical protein
MKFPLLCASVMGLGSVGCLCLCGGPASAEDRGVIRVQKPPDSASPCESFEKERKTLEGAPQDELRRLKGDQDDSIAVGAAWEEILRALPKYDAAITERSASTSVQVQGIPRFLGFLEGRLRIPLPEWWAAEMKIARGFDRQSFFFFRNAPPQTRTDNSKARGLGPEFGTVPTIVRDFKGAPHELVRGGDITVSWDQHRIRLAGDTMDTLAGDRCAGIVQGEECLVAHFPSVWPADFHLYCVDWRAGKSVWSTMSRLGCSRILGAHGPGSHSVDLLIRGGAVYVFGMADDVAYIDAIALADGRNLFRFSTSHHSD